MPDFSLNFNKQAFLSRSALMSNEQNLQVAIQRLSTGKKFNAPSDGPASFSVLSRMGTSLQVGQQGVVNGQNGTSLLTTADAALANIEKSLNAIAVLAEDAANGVWTEDQRKVFDSQAQSLLKVVDDISQATEFNGRPVLDGSMSTGLTLQLGTTTASFDQITLDMPSTRSAVLFAGKTTPKPGGAVSLTNQENALASLANVNSALKTIRGHRADIGAAQQGITINIANRNSMNEEAKNTISNIGDADVAIEMENYTNFSAKTQAASYMYTIAMQNPSRIAQMIQAI